VLYYIHLADLDGVVSRLVAALRPGGRLLLLHGRSIKDDTVGMALKEFGARTVHEAFLRDSRLHVEEDVLDGMHRITLLSGAPQEASPRRRNRPADHRSRSSKSGPIAPASPWA
jgi:hypothetical protein